MSTTRTVIKDFYRLTKAIDSFSDGQAKIVPNEESLSNPDIEGNMKFTFEVDITPNGGPYLGGTFRFKILVENESLWPQNPPIVRSLTNIYHPNIDQFDETECSNVCVSTLDLLHWNSQCDFETGIQALLFLFYEPNFDDALSLVCQSEENFQELVQISIKGGIIDGIPFEPNEGWIKRNPLKNKSYYEHEIAS